MHEEPQILHFGRPATGLTLREGMVFTIEPMLNEGRRAVRMEADGWTVVTVDGKLSAQFEHTVAVTRDGGQTFDTTGNRFLANLECYSTVDTRDFYGTLSVQGDLVASGLQDNGNVVCQRAADGTLGPWAPIEGCDGGAVAFIATGQVLTDMVCSRIGTNLWVRSLHGRSLYDIDKGSGLPAQGRPGTPVLNSPKLEVVTAPAIVATIP